MPITYNISQNPVPVGISGTPTGATQRQAYSWSPTVTGGFGVRIFSMTGTLPERMTFNPFTGTIAGIPRHVISVSGLSITVTDASGSATLSNLTIPVASAISNLMITGTPAAATVGTAFTFTPTVTGGTGPRVFSFSGRLEDGLRFNPVDGSISGTPTEDGGSFFIITVQDSVDTATLSGTVVASYPGGAVGPVLTPYTLTAETQAIVATAAFSSVSAGRKNRMDRMIRRWKNNGYASKITGLWVLGETEAQFKVNLASPGTYDLTAVGAPTYSTTTGASGFSDTAYYRITGSTLAALSAPDVGIGYRSSSGGASDNPTMGAIDGTAGLSITGYNTTSRPAVRLFATSISSAAPTTSFAATGLISASTVGGAGRLSRYGAKIVAIAPTYVPSASTAELFLGKANGVTGASPNAVSAAWITKGLTEAEEADFAASVTDYINCVLYGDPFIYEMGVGPATINAQVVVYGTGPAALAAAYNAKRNGFSVALLGEYGDRTIWDVGGMPSNGLNWIDAKVFTKVGGIFRDMISYANSVSGVTDSNTQAAESPEPRYFQAAVRRMLDPTRTSGTYIPGMDVPVYMTGGIASVKKTGVTITSIVTNDGRTVSGSIFMDCSDDGDLVYYSGAPSFTGREAAGPGAEANDGYLATYTVVPFAGAARSVSPYVTDGNAGSGLLPNLITPSLSAGVYDPGHQAMNYRLTLSNGPARRTAFFDATTPPPGYNALNYEGLARACAAATAAGATITTTDILGIQGLSNASAIFDANNAGMFGTDLPGSGVAYAAAGANLAARKAITTNIRNYIRGLFYFLRYGNDARVAPAATAIASYYFDPLSHLDPGPDGVLWFPNRAYVREPTFMLKNTGAVGSGVAVIDGNDLDATDGTTPRSVKTLTISNYRSDIHQLRLVDDGGVIKSQGGFDDSAAGGTDQIAPIWMEAMMPDKAVCTNLLTATALSMTKLAHAAYRMEPSRSQGGESLAQVAAYAIANGVAVQDVDYPTVRAALLANADVTKMVLPTQN